MRYHVKDADGRELVVPTLADLHALYDHGFLGDDDLVRSETSDRWVRAGAMPALAGVRLRRAEPRKLIGVSIAVAAAIGAAGLLVARASPLVLLLAAAAIVAAIALLVRRR